MRLLTLSLQVEMEQNANNNEIPAHKSGLHALIIYTILLSMKY